MESSRGDLLNDMAEHAPILKNNRNTYHPCFGFTPKTGIAFPKTSFFLSVCSKLAFVQPIGYAVVDDARHSGLGDTVSFFSGDSRSVVHVVIMYHVEGRAVASPARL